MPKKNKVDKKKPLLLFCAFRREYFIDSTHVFFTTYEDWTTDHCQSDCIEGEAGEFLDKLIDKYPISEAMESIYGWRGKESPERVIDILKKESGLCYDEDFAAFINKE